MSETITLSSKYQIVIPKAVREIAGWKAGEKLVPLVKGRQVTLVPLRPLKELYGIAAGAKIGPIEDEEDRF
ncbi:MAG: AbrB/MazE/SpoVT family DNA-binding domain-containing protein [Armatimonadia bacterium]